MRYAVFSSVSGSRVSDWFDNEPNGLCASMNGRSGGAFHVRDEANRRSFDPNYGVEIAETKPPIIELSDLDDTWLKFKLNLGTFGDFFVTGDDAEMFADWLDRITDGQSDQAETIRAFLLENGRPS